MGWDLYGRRQGPAAASVEGAGAEEGGVGGGGGRGEDVGEAGEGLQPLLPAVGGGGVDANDAAAEEVVGADAVPVHDGDEEVGGLELGGGDVEGERLVVDGVQVCPLRRRLLLPNAPAPAEFLDPDVGVCIAALLQSAGMGKGWPLPEAPVMSMGRKL